jgi:Rhs family protein
MTPPNGVQPRFIITIQPPGAVFDPPAPITIPNVDGLTPGGITKMYSFDHDMGQFVVIGTGTVSEDGLVVRSDSGVGVIKAGWHCGGNPATSGSCEGKGDFDEPCSDLQPASIIEAQNQILGEGFGVSGIQFRLHYKSDRVPGRKVGGTFRSGGGGGSSSSGGGGGSASGIVILPFDARDFGLGGWSLDIHHIYRITGKVFYGNGTKGVARNVNSDSNVTDIVIPSSGGSQLYYFDNSSFAVSKKHLRTVSAQSGLTLYTFSYNSSGMLTSIVDADGNVMLIERSGDTPTAIVAPDGQRTSLTLDADGYLKTITNPAGEKIELAYGNEGLMETLKDRRGNIHTYAYDSLGRLVSDGNPAGGSWTLDRKGTNHNYDVTMTTAMDRIYTYKVKRSIVSGSSRTNTDPSSLVTNTHMGYNGSNTTTVPDGTTYSAGVAASPRWGNKLYKPISSAVTTPGGISYSRNIGRSVTLNTKTLPDLTVVPDPMSLKTETTTININSNVYRTVYDAGINKVTATTPAGRTISSNFDVKDRIVKLQPGNLEPINVSYDSRGRLSKLSQGTGTGERVYGFSYNTAGYLSGITDPLSNNVSFAYDPVGRLTKETLADGRDIIYTYDANDNVTSIQPPGRPAHNFTYRADA